MYLEIDYEERNAGIRIWRCRGYGEVLKVPEMLEGKNGDRTGTLCVILFQTS